MCIKSLVLHILLASTKKFSYFSLSQGHARLMNRKEVTVQDAVVAVSLIESSMQNSALVAGINALHTTFPDNPIDEYKQQG